jgi:two-component sensor histidine kinase
MTDRQPFADVDGRALAQAIVDTTREPLLVLDGTDMRVITASRSFYSTFKTTREETQGRPLYELGEGQWDIPVLRALLEAVVPEHSTVEGYEVERDFPRIGRRAMLLNARKVFYPGNNATTLLLAFEDVTARRAAEREKDELLAQAKLLLSEMQHRVANSLQIIASILLMKARAVVSSEVRMHLEDAHDRVLAIASIQEQLQGSLRGEKVPVAPYLVKLCDSLGKSMIGDRRPLSIDVVAESGEATSTRAVSLGLITTELVINALKHAFPGERTGKIVVRYEAMGLGWQLSRVATDRHPPHVGLGTSIVDALARQLEAHVESSSTAFGTRVAVVHAAA